MRKRMISIVLALVMIVLPMDIMQVRAESSSLVYYDLQQQEVVSYNGGNFSKGYIWKSNTPIGGFIGQRGWAGIEIKQNKADGSTFKSITFNTPNTTMEHKIIEFGLMTNSLNPDGDYSVPLRKVTLSFKSTSEDNTLYDKPIALWFNLYAVSRKGLLEMADGTVRTLDDELKTILENDEKYSDTDLILFWSNISSHANTASTSESKGGALYPICKVGTVGQSDYTSTIEYIYELGSNNSLIARQIKIGSKALYTLLDSSMPFNGLKFEYNSDSETRDYYLPGNLKPDFESEYNGGSEALKGKNLVSVISCQKIANEKKGSKLSFKELKYEGLRDYGEEIRIVGDKGAAPVAGDNLIEVSFYGIPNTGVSGFDWKEHIVIKDAQNNPFTNWEINPVQGKQNTYTISIAPENHLAHSTGYSVTKKNTLQYLGGTPTNMTDIAKSFVTTYAMLECSSASSSAVEGNFEVSVDVENTSLLDGQFDITAALYKKDAGVVNMIDTAEADGNIALGDSDTIDVDTFVIPNDGAQYFIKVFFTKNGEVVADPVIIGEAAQADIDDVTAGAENITLDINTTVDNGGISVDGKYTGAEKNPLFVTVTNEAGETVYTDCLAIDENGKFGMDFNLLPGSASGDYTVNVKAIGETLVSEAVPMDFSSLKPVVTGLSLVGVPYCGRWVEADYDYFHFGGAVNKSEIIWYANIGEGDAFIEIGTEKTIELTQNLLGKMIKFTVLAKTADGITAENTVEYGPFKATAGPVASNAAISQSGNELSVKYDFSHALGYEEQGSSIVWYRANSLSSTYSKVGEGAVYTIVETDNNKYFKAEITPKVAEGELQDIEHTGEMVTTKPIKAQYDNSDEVEKPDVSKYLYYQLEDQASTGANTSGYGYGSISSVWGETVSKAQGGFLRRNSWSQVKVADVSDDNGTYKTIFFVSDPYVPKSWAKPTPFGMLIGSLNQEGDYDVPYRKATLSFKTSAAAEDIYDEPVAVWFNLYAISREGLLALDDGIHTMTNALREKVEACEENSLILFWWDLKNLSLIDSTDAANGANLYPICTLGAVGQSEYSDVEYIYALGNDGTNDTVEAVQIKVNGEIKNTLIDETTAFNTLVYTDTNTDGDTIYKPSSLKASYTDKPYVAVMGVPNNYKKTSLSSGDIEAMTLTFKKLTYEGMGSYVSDISVQGGEDAAEVYGEGLVKISFAEEPDTNAISDWADYIEIRKADDTPLAGWSGEYNEAEKVYTISVAQAQHLEHSAQYSVVVKKELPYVGIDYSNAEDEVLTFVTDYKKLVVSNVPSTVTGGSFAVTAKVTNDSLSGGEFTVTAALYREDAGILNMYDSISKTENVALGSSENISIGTFSVPDDGAQYFVKIIFTQNGDIIADRAVIGQEIPAEVVDITAGANPITLAFATTTDTGKVEMDGKYSGTLIRPLYVSVKNPAGSVIFIDRVEVDENGRFGMDFNIPQSSPDGNYTIEVKAIGETLYTETLPMNFASVKPVVSNLSLLGYAYCGKTVEADYDYYHFDAEADSSIIKWFANTGSGGRFTQIGTGKTIALTDNLMGKMVKFTVQAKTADGDIGNTEEYGPFKATAGPVASNIVISQNNNLLSFTYSFSHALGYEEQGSSYSWYRASTQNGTYTKVYDGAAYTVTSADNNMYFKVEVIPKVAPEGLIDIEAQGESVLSSAFAAEYKTTSTDGGSYDGGTGGGGGGGSRIPKENTVEITPLDTSGTVDLTDIKGHWAESDIYNLYDKGIIKGRTEHTFDPEGKITRAEFVALIVRALNIQEVTNTSFGDVNENDWYAGVIGAALGNGILTGSEGNAYPNRRITRQEMAAITVRAFELGGEKIALDGDILGIDDAATIDTWAIEAVAKAKLAGLIKGDGNNYRPLDNTSRAEAAVIVSRLLAMQ